MKRILLSETKTLVDGGPAFIDHTKCALPFSNDNGCTLCIKHCPFSYADYDQLKARYEAAHHAEMFLHRFATLPA